MLAPQLLLLSLAWICLAKSHSNRTTMIPKATTLLPIKLAVILPSESPYMFRSPMVKPAIEFALSSVKGEMASMGYRYEVSYRKSFCSRRAGISAVDLYYGDDVMYDRSQALYGKPEGRKRNFPYLRGSVRKRRELPENQNISSTKTSYPAVRPSGRNRDLPLVFLGPVCNEAASVVSEFAESWNVPVITSGAPAATIMPDVHYSTLTRIGASHYDLAQFIYFVFSTLGYGRLVPVHMLYEEGWESGTAEKECRFVIQTLLAVLPAMDPDFLIIPPKYVVGDFDEDKVAREMRNPRVVVMCASSDAVRRIMIGAYRNGHANPRRTHWYAIDLHNRTHYSQGAWKRGDKDDSIAKEAYKALMSITIYARSSAKFNEFRKAMLRRYEKAEIEEDVNEFVVGFHDAVILHKEAIRRSLQQGIDIQDGMAVTSNMRNISFDGIAGPVIIGMFGDRRGDYSILTMTDYKSAYDYLGTVPEVWNHGLPMLNLADKVSYQNYTSLKNRRRADLIAKQKEAKILAESTGSDEILAGILGTGAGMIICCILVFGPVCYHRRHRQRIPTSENGNAFGELFTGNSDQVSLHRPLREEGSVATCTTTLDDELKL